MDQKAVGVDRKGKRAGITGKASGKIVDRCPFLRLTPPLMAHNMANLTRYLGWTSTATKGVKNMETGPETSGEPIDNETEVDILDRYRLAARRVLARSGISRHRASVSAHAHVQVVNMRPGDKLGDGAAVEVTVWVRPDDVAPEEEPILHTNAAIWWQTCLRRGWIETPGVWPTTIETSRVVDAFMASPFHVIDDDRRSAETRVGMTIAALVGAKITRAKSGSVRVRKYVLPSLKACRSRVERIERVGA